jgi:ADP-heptose:LPS heptosyltransferase
MTGSPDADARVRRRLDALGVPAGADVVVVHVGAGNEFRRWPEASFAALVADLLADAPDRRIILTTGPGQAQTAEAIRRIAVASGTPAASLPVLCDLDLQELRSLIARARLFVGGDSGPAHVAATTPVPMVVLFGPTTPAVWGAWRPSSFVTETVDAGTLPCRPCDQRRCEPGDFRCLRWIVPEAVRAAAARAMARETARRTLT